MGTRIHEAWGGNRVYNGSAWMELYYAVDGELNDDHRKRSAGGREPKRGRR